MNISILVSRESVFVCVSINLYNTAESNLCTDACASDLGFCIFNNDDVDSFLKMCLFVCVRMCACVSVLVCVRVCVRGGET